MNEAVSATTGNTAGHDGEGRTSSMRGYDKAAGLPGIEAPLLGRLT